MKNQDIARIFQEIALYLEMQEENVFKIRAYENAAVSIGSMAEDGEEIYRKGGGKAL